jgi:adenosylmethionine-8-amino-7-oxononanoate aminotransferase
MITHGQGPYLFTADGRKLLDFTAGGTEHAAIGWSHPDVVEAVRSQAGLITHVDIKFYRERNAEELAELLVNNAGNDLNSVYFAGNSGGEACEAAMKLSFQYFQDRGEIAKKWFLFRQQSYHGITSDTLSMCDRPNLLMYEPFHPRYRAAVPEHNQYRHLQEGETPEDYARRSARELEQKICEVGAENICGFIAETMQGGLVGAVPPSPGYWDEIRNVCTAYGIHLILDEVWCGNGVSGRYFCVDWDGITPDFLYMGKNLGASYAPVSVVMTTPEIAHALETSGQGRIQHGSTYQSYTLGIAAALAVQKVITAPGMLDEVNRKGQRLMSGLVNRLGNHPYFRNVRGRGLRCAMEFSCVDLDGFAQAVAGALADEGILIGGKWHRFLFTPALIVTDSEIDQVLDRFADCFRAIADRWPGNAL